MDKLLRDMEDLCQSTAAERGERYRKSVEMARISELLQSTGWILCDGGIKIGSPIEEDWTEQALEDEEMDKIRARDDKGEIQEALRATIDELQDMVELLEYMEKIEGYTVTDLLQELESSIAKYYGGI